MVHVRSMPAFIAMALGFVAGIAMTESVAHSAMILGIEQVGSNVVATASGSITATPGTIAGFGGDFIVPSAALITLGPDLNPAGAQYTLSGPTNFGPGGVTVASSSTGTSVAIDGQLSFLLLPTGYVSGTAISATDTFSSTTLASMGITPGTYSYTVGTGLTTDTLTIYAGVPVPSVPEPATIALAGMGLPALGLWVLKRRSANRVA